MDNEGKICCYLVILICTGIQVGIGREKGEK